MANKKAKAKKASKHVVATQPGVIKSIMDLLTKAKQSKKPITASGILEQLTKQFPDRKAEGMMVTVRAQLSRLPSEKEFAISKKRDGRVTLYAAA